MRSMKELSPRVIAGMAGLMYLLIFLTAPSGAATATPVTMFMNLIADTGVALFFYYLFMPVSKGISLIGSLFRLVFVAMMGVNSLNYFGTTEFLQVSHSSDSFNRGYGIALIPFGFHCVLTGYLILKSTFLPRILRADGAGWRGISGLPVAATRRSALLCLKSLFPAF